MHTLRKAFWILTALNVVALMYFMKSDQSVKPELTAAHARPSKQSSFLTTKLQTTLNKNPFIDLGAYPEFNVENYSFVPANFSKVQYGLVKDNNYCEKTDLYNIRHPDNIFDEMNFYSDSYLNSHIRKTVMEQIGASYNTESRRKMPEKEFSKELYHLSPKITTFYTYGSLFRTSLLGKQFLCATQMYNHIPGTGALIRKDTFLERLSEYAIQNQHTPECFNKDAFFLPYFRLFEEQECRNFFTLINSEAYRASLKAEPIQYLVKVGHGAHKSLGVDLLDNNKTQELNTKYENGNLCGQVPDFLLAQKYITNPLLLDRNNKFDFRIYMLIASTNPLIVFYHDGYMRVSVKQFEKNSGDRAAHLTNTYVAEKIFAEMKSKQTRIDGMDHEELKDYHLWHLEDLELYLYESGKITDKNWLENYLRPQFKKAYTQLIRITSPFYWRQSNVFELHGLDFMLDENLELWFIESNPNPLLDGVKPELITEMLTNMFDIVYSYYRSRMARVLSLISVMKEELEKSKSVDMDTYKQKYQDAWRNKLEPQYRISKRNTWEPVIDETLPKEQAYFGNIASKCF